MAAAGLLLPRFGSAELSPVATMLGAGVSGSVLLACSAGAVPPLTTKAGAASFAGAVFLLPAGEVDVGVAEFGPAETGVAATGVSTLDGAAEFVGRAELEAGGFALESGTVESVMSGVVVVADGAIADGAAGMVAGFATCGTETGAGRFIPLLLA